MQDISKKEEHNKLQAEMGLNNFMLAEKLEVDISTIERRRSGKSPVKHETILAMKFLKSQIK